MIIDEYIPVYAEAGFQPVIVHVGDQMAFGCDLSREFGAHLPLLLDSDDTLLNIYQQVGAESSLFPLAYLIDRDLTVKHVYNNPEEENEESKSPKSLLDDLEALLEI